MQKTNDFFYYLKEKNVVFCLLADFAIVKAVAFCAHLSVKVICLLLNSRGLIIVLC